MSNEDKTRTKRGTKRGCVRAAQLVFTYITDVSSRPDFPPSFLGEGGGELPHAHATRAERYHEAGTTGTEGEHPISASRRPEIWPRDVHRIDAIRFSRLVSRIGRARTSPRIRNEIYIVLFVTLSPPPFPVSIPAVPPRVSRFISRFRRSLTSRGRAFSETRTLPSGKPRRSCYPSAAPPATVWLHANFGDRYREWVFPRSRSATSN